MARDDVMIAGLRREGTRAVGNYCLTLGKIDLVTS